MDRDRSSLIRVLYYNHSGEVSGAEISLLLTISHMRGIEPILIAPEGELLARARALQVPIRPVHGFRARMTRNPLRILKGTWGTWRAGRELRQIIRQVQPDIVHANSIRAGLIASMAKPRHGVKIVWHVRDNLPKNIVGWMIRKVAAVKADRIIAISNAIRDNFATTPKLKQKTEIVHNGIDTSVAEGTSFRPELGVSKDTFVVGVVGQIAPWKRQHDAIEAFYNFSHVVPNSELWIVGAPKFRNENFAYAQELRNHAQDIGLKEKIRFLGFREDVMNIMASIDVLLIPSDKEPFGRVVIEAMFFGKPVIGTNNGGIPEIVGHESGVLFECGDTLAMEKLLLSLYEDATLRKDLGVTGHQIVVGKFSIHDVANRIRRIYVSTLTQEIRGQQDSLANKRIVLVANDVGGIGGMEKHLEELISRFKERYQVTVVATTMKLKDSSGVRFIRVPAVRRPFPLMITMFSLYASIKIWFIRKDARTIVHTTGAIVWNRTDVSTVHFCHAGWKQSESKYKVVHQTIFHKFNSIIGMWIKLRMERYSYQPKITTHLVPVSQRIRQELSEFYPYSPTSITTISNGVDIERFRPGTNHEKEQLRARHGLPLMGTYAIFVGGDWERKGVRYLLEAFNRLGEEHSDLHVLVVGGGDVTSFRSLVMEPFRHRVHFVGRRADPETWYRLSDIFVFPSKYEACSLAVLEAAASGLSMVVSNVGGAEDLVEEGVTGFFIERTAEAISDTLHFLLMNPSVMHRTARAVRKKVETSTWEHTYEEFTKLYESVWREKQTRGTVAFALNRKLYVHEEDIK